jgi:DNA transposition AAA+ family ATPase
MPHATTIAERRDAILQAPSSEGIIEEVNAYLAAAHLGVNQFATYINYSHVTVRAFLANRYWKVGGSDKNIRKAIRAFLDANPIQATPENQGKFYQTENVATLQKWFDHCLAVESGRGRMVAVYSGPGGQKTFISENLVARFNQDNVANPDRPRAFHLYCSQDITPGQLVVKILATAGISSAGLLQKNLASLRYSLRNRRVIFIFDEAQHLSIPCLEIIRELNDLRPYFGIMLLGSHKLRLLFDQRAAEMEQWNSRLTASIELPGIGLECARQIVQEELAGVTPLSDRKIDTLLKSSYADDIYSREKKTYLSARRLFRSIEQIKEAAAKSHSGEIQ